MKGSWKPVPLVVAALIVASALGACTAKPASTATPTSPATPAALPGGVDVALAAIKWPDGAVVARVNDVEIKTEQWRAEVTRQIQIITDQYAVDWNDQSNCDHLPEIEDMVLERLVNMELLRQLAAKEAVTVSDADIQETNDMAKQQITAGGQYADLADYLQSNGLTQEEFDRMIREQAMINKMIELHGGPTEMEQVHARHILVADEQKAKEVLDKLAAKEPFDALAKTYSTDTGTKDQGGDLGWFPHGTMVQEFEEAAFALQPGQTSDAVQTVYGYHIIHVDERGVRKLEEPLLSQFQEQAFSTWLEEQNKNAKIERLYATSPTPQPR